MGMLNGNKSPAVPSCGEGQAEQPHTLVGVRPRKGHIRAAQGYSLGLRYVACDHLTRVITGLAPRLLSVTCWTLILPISQMRRLSLSSRVPPPYFHILAPSVGRLGLGVGWGVAPWQKAEPWTHSLPYHSVAQWPGASHLWFLICNQGKCSTPPSHKVWMDPAAWSLVHSKKPRAGMGSCVCRPPSCLPGAPQPTARALSGL